MLSAIIFEFVATLIFVIVILGSAQKSAPAGFAGLAIGITLVVIHIFGIHITGVSVNPARSPGPALLWAAKRWRRCGSYIYWYSKEADRHASQPRMVAGCAT